MPVARGGNNAFCAGNSLSRFPPQASKLLPTLNREKVVAKAKSAKRKQAFSIRTPVALSVRLLGDFTHWQKALVPMRKEAGGLWHATVELAPGTHHYRFLVVGEWRDDPENTLRVPNPFGGENAVRKVA